MKNAIKISIAFTVLAATLSLITSSATDQWSWGILNFHYLLSNPLMFRHKSFRAILLSTTLSIGTALTTMAGDRKSPLIQPYGFGIRYTAIFNTILDLLEGSRVLDVYRPPSVFLLGHGSSGPYAQHGIIIYPGGGCLHLPIDDTPILKF